MTREEAESFLHLVYESTPRGFFIDHAGDMYIDFKMFAQPGQQKIRTIFLQHFKDVAQKRAVGMYFLYKDEARRIICA